MESDNQALQLVIILLIALMFMTYKYQQQRNYIRENLTKKENPETNYLNIDKYKLKKIKLEHTLTDIDYRHITESELRKRFSVQLSKYIFDNNIMKIERDLLSSENEKTKFVSEIYIAIRNNEL